MDRRKRATLQKLYENNSLTYGQVEKLKTAIAASEIVPLLVYSPYLLVMLRKCATANTQQRFV